MVYGDDNAPATKKDLAVFATKKDIADFATKKDLADFATKKDIVDVRQDMSKMGSQLRQEMSDLRVELRQEMSDLKNYMSVFGENLAADFRDASKDQVEVLKDTLLLHDRRITRLEDRAVAA